jgi:hypothetical protein
MGDMDLFNCWKAYGRWLRALNSGQERNNLYSINYRAIQKRQEEREMDDWEEVQTDFPYEGTSD